MAKILGYRDFINRINESAAYTLPPVPGTTGSSTIFFEKVQPTGKWGHNRVKVTYAGKSTIYKLRYNTPFSSGDMNFKAMWQDNGTNGPVYFSRYVEGGTENEKMDYKKIKEYLPSFKKGENVKISELGGSLEFIKIS